jgi:hypothetical protein
VCGFVWVFGLRKLKLFSSTFARNKNTTLMTETTSNQSKLRYNFNTNLVALSDSKDINKAKDEWFYVYNETRDTNSGHCICQHKLRHIYYMYNVVTQHIISVGSGCHKKFGLQETSVKSKTLKKVLSDALTNHEYELIDNPFEYTVKIEKQLMDFITNKYENYKNKIEKLLVYFSKEEDELVTKLKLLCEEVENLIEEYKLVYLHEILEQIKMYLRNRDEENAKKSEYKRIKQLEELKEAKRVREKMERMREEELKMILFQKEEVEKKERDEKRKKYEERKSEKRERESMSNEEIFIITEKAKLLREERNANFDTIKLEHFKKILEKERKQKEKRRLRELNKEKIRENLANK